MTDLPQWTRTFSKRTLARMSGGVFVEGEHDADAARVHLSPGESVIGLYAVAGAPDYRKVFVAEDSVVFFDGLWCRVPYVSIARATVDLAGITKMEAEKIRLEQDDGTTHIVSILGGGPRHRDGFEFVRFLTRVASAHRTPRQ